MTRLHIPVLIQSPSAGEIRASALIDTGSEVNLVRRELLPQNCFDKSLAPIRFRAANHTIMDGGQLDATFFLSFSGTDIDTGGQATLNLPITCYDADISADIIISYEWLASMKIDVVPRKHGLMLQGNGTALWVTGQTSHEERIPHMPTVSMVNRTAQVVDPEEFAIRREFFGEVVQQLGLRPTVDLFSSSTNFRCTRFVTPREDAFRVPWDTSDIFWMNPPGGYGPRWKNGFPRLPVPPSCCAPLGASHGYASCSAWRLGAFISNKAHACSKTKATSTPGSLGEYGPYE